jgi:prepilin-type N-terminal cleavage/methylation domain-containing protein
MRDRVPGRPGFSLIELVIAMTVLSVALLAIAGMFHVGYRDVASGTDITLATETGRQMLEELRTLPFDGLDLFLGGGWQTDAAVPLVADDDPFRDEKLLAVDLARKWQYTFEGTGVPPANEGWVTLRSGRGDAGSVARGTARITVAVPAGFPQLRTIRVLVTYDNRSPAATPLLLTTVINRM